MVVVVIVEIAVAEEVAEIVATVTTVVVIFYKAPLRGIHSEAFSTRRPIIGIHVGRYVVTNE